GIGASAGGLEPLKLIAAGLPADLRAAVTVVLHVSPEAESRLPQILARAGPLPATHAVDGEPVLAGRIYVAPPDHHLVLRGGRCAVVRGPRENGSRPAIDPLFRSAAGAYGRRAVAVLLSGTGADGVAGAQAVAALGGTVLVQDPAEAVFPSIPANVVEHDSPSRVLPAAEIAAAVAEVVASLPGELDVEENGQEALDQETRYTLLDGDSLAASRPVGVRAALGCPACGGTLWEINDADLPRYRCRVGHAYAAEELLAAESENLESALWVALRALLERAELCRRVADRSRRSGSELTARRFDRLAEEALEQAGSIRAVLLERDAVG